MFPVIKTMSHVIGRGGLGLLMASVAVCSFAQEQSRQLAAQPEHDMREQANQYSPGAYEEASNNCYAAAEGCGCPNCCSNAGSCTTGYARVEYLMWWSNGRSTPPLATTSPAGTVQADAGVLDDPDTSVLFGGDYGEGLRNGGRVTVGHSLGGNGEFSVNGRFFGLQDSTASFFADSAAGDPILARPFFNTTLVQQDALLVAFPGITSPGSIGIQAHNDVLGADVYLRNIFWWDGSKRVDFLVGYQFSRIDDSIFIDSDFTSVDPLSANPVGTTFSVSDSFRTQNEFHGGQIGAITEWQRGRAWFELLTKVAVGNMRQRAIVSGETVRTEPFAVPTVDGSGLLVQGTNAGDRQRDQFSFIPEIGFTVGYQVSSRLSLTMGYSFIYWNDVLLAGNQIDPRLNLTQNPGPIVGPAQPEFVFNDNDFWVQGLSFGGEFRF
jgi:hypothetical protein